MRRIVAVVFALACMVSFAGCKGQQTNGHDMVSKQAEVGDGNHTLADDEESVQYVCVEWNDFIKLEGVSYIGDWHVTEVPETLIGEKMGEVTCGVPTVYTDGAGNMTSAETEDGASFLCEIGTELFSVTGSENAIAALVDGTYYLYVPENHPAGLVGSKLYVVVNGCLHVFERYEAGTGNLTKMSLLGSFETETEIEGIIWKVYSAEEYTDLSYVLLISGTNASWTYRSEK
ncbi:MAG: hypothetical protein IJZ55_04540 [Lachnospiraceae bacterium]|nr:hypothetical protein [Lachnospiraceae bacterium]